MPNKIPVIATDFEISRELIKNPDAGYLFPNRSSLKLAEQIDHILNSTEEVKKKVSEGYKKAVSLFNHQNNFEKILAIYRSL